MASVAGIKPAVLKKIKPGRDEEQKVSAFVRNLMDTAKRVSGLEAVIVGSIGKGTWLRGDHDIDLFMLFPKETSRNDLEKKGLEYGKKIISRLGGRHEIKYSEHPYVRGHVKGFLVDVVPCYRISRGEKIISAVDRSPLHLQHIIENMDKHDEARLLKQFCKGAGVYGSDVVMQGISGYICELLVLKYGSFEAVMKAAAEWEPGVVVSLDNQPHDRKKFYNHPLVLIDPIDPGRNVAANLSHENFVRFVSAAKSFLEKPSPGMFWYRPPKPLTSKQITALRSRGTHFVALLMKKPGVVDDILYPQMRRAINRIETLLRQNDFVILRSMEYVDSEMMAIFELASSRLENIKKMRGPPMFSRKHSREFLEKYRHAGYGPYLEGEYWVIEKKREFVTAEALLKAFAKEKHLEAAGIPDNIAKALKKCRIVNPLDAAKKNKSLSAFLNKKYFERLS